jgi:hypothetical protein
MMIIFTVPTIVYNTNEVFQHQGLGYGDQSNNRFYMNLRANMDNRRKQEIQEMKTIHGISIGGQVRNECFVNTFDKGMHCDFGSMGSGNPLANEVNSGEDNKGTFWYFLIVNLIVHEVVEVFRSAKPKLRNTQRRDEEMDTDAETFATPHAGPDLG